MRTNLFKVSLNIRILLVMLCSLSMVYCGSSLAQSSTSTNKDTPLKTADEQALRKQDASEKTAQNTNKPKPILRLEDTIRGNKEQPQVLTIVPWQLPVHQRINENTQWHLQVSQLSTIERNAFLRKLAIAKEIKAEKEPKIPLPQTSNNE